MSVFNTPQDVLKRINQLRLDHAQLRIEVATKSALGLAYANGRQWTSVNTGSFGNTVVDSWDEDWDLNSSEIRVVDNRIGPLVRKIAASTNATAIEAAVSPKTHNKSFQAADQASVAQSILNSVSHDARMTAVARMASSFRWQAGSAIIAIQLSKKKKIIPVSILKHADGSPLEINDQWVRWQFCPLSDLIWEPSNISHDLNDHSTLILEQVLTLRKFTQIYGSVENYGLAEGELPTISELAPHHLAASELYGTSFFSSVSQSSHEKAVRVSTLYETDPRDPDRWWLEYITVDATPAGTQQPIAGRVINMDNPQSPFGGHGRPLFKLDAFKRNDAVLALGAPHVMMGDQDRLNILKSIQFQQLSAVVHGQWIVDTSGTDADEFASKLNMGIGGVLSYNSRMGQVQPPAFVTPDPPRQEFTTFGADIVQGMQGQVHITAANLGVGKTHIPKGIQKDLLKEGNSVIDNIIKEDTDVYSDALRVTLGTIRFSLDGPGRMLARLRDRHGFTLDDLRIFHEIDPIRLPFNISVREHSIISRSIEERIDQIGQALEVGAITPVQYAIIMAEELERPIMNSHDKQLQFIAISTRHILEGMDWPGIPHLNVEIFIHVIENAMWGLDIKKPEDSKAMARLQKAILTQKQLTQENTLPNPLDNQQGGGLLSSEGGQSSGIDQRGGPPESINPLTNPVGASGGLPNGLT